MRYILLLIIIIFFSGCVTSTIEIYNNTNNDASFYLKSALIVKEPVIIQAKSDIFFLYQFGINFSDSNLNDLVENIEFIQLSSRKSNLLINDKTKILRFLKENRKGVFKNKIKIIIN